MKNNYNSQEQYAHYTVNEEKPLLEWLLSNINSESRSKIKATLL